MNPLHCGQPMREIQYDSRFRFFVCEVKPARLCGETVMFCSCQKEMTKTKGIFGCSCGVKETYCKNPIFSFNGVLDSDCGNCPGDYEISRELGGEG